MSTDPLLEINGIKKYYAAESGFLSRLLGRQDQVKAVDDLDLTIDRGETFGVIGESGSGKSTLIETTLRLEDPTEGEILFDGEDICEYSNKELRAFRERAQIIFQDPYETLNPKKTIFQALAEPLKNFRDLDREELRTNVETTLEGVGLHPAEEYMYSFPEQLSGGERQRVSIGRAIVLDPDLLVADEPLSMLDVSLQSGILRLLDRLQAEHGFAIFYVTHNLSVMKLIADRIGVMYRGRIVEQGVAEQIVGDPKHPYTRALVASLPTLTGERERVLLPISEADDDENIQGCQFHPRCPDAMAECSQAVPALNSSQTDRQVACYLHHDVAEGDADVNPPTQQEDGKETKRPPQSGMEPP
jgi:peptide/nickel transport system ATP-binding protein